MSSTEPSSPLPFNFDNFFPHLIIHPKHTTKDDEWKSWLASVVLGIFTAGLLHLGCWIHEKLKERDIEVITPEKRTTQTEITHAKAQSVIGSKNPDPVAPVNLKPKEEITFKASVRVVTNLDYINGDVTRPEKVFFSEGVQINHSITLEDGSPLPPSNNDYVHLQIFNSSTNLAAKAHDLCLMVPQSLLLGKKHGDLIRLRYEGKPIELEINQILASRLSDSTLRKFPINKPTAGTWVLTWHDNPRPNESTTEALEVALSKAPKSNPVLPTKYLLENRGDHFAVVQSALPSYNVENYIPLSGQTLFTTDTDHITYSIQINSPGFNSESGHIEIFHKDDHFTVVAVPNDEKISTKKVDKSSFSASLIGVSHSVLENALKNGEVVIEHGQIKLTIRVPRDPE